MRNRLIAVWPWLLALSLLLGATGIALAIAIPNTGGLLVYALDDAYIHMAMAKNIIGYSVWGVTRHSYSASSSSPLWTALLAAVFKTFGIRESIPLLLNGLFAGCVLWSANRILLRENAPNGWRFFILLLAAFAAPLPALILGGMEHTLQTWLTLAACLHAADFLAGDRSAGRPLLLFLLAPVLILTRFEGLFLIGPVCGLLLLQKRFRPAAALGFSALLPAAVFGLWSVGQGGYLLPNSVLLKGNHLQPDASLAVALMDVVHNAAIHALLTPHLIVLMSASCLSIAMLFKQGRLHGTAGYANILFLAASMLHLQFAAVRWFFRYEAYLVFLGIILLGFTLSRLSIPAGQIQSRSRMPRAWLAGAALAACLLFILTGRAVDSLRIAPQAMNNIYEQHYQTALFVRRYYTGSTVIANDIGALTYYADIRLVDLSGLASMDIARAKLEGGYSPEMIRTYALQQGAVIAIVYEDWFTGIGGLPADWRKAGDWKIRERVVSGGDTIAFFSLTPEGFEKLARSLTDFGVELPLEVEYLVYRK